MLFVLMTHFISVPVYVVERKNINPLNGLMTNT